MSSAPQPPAGSAPESPQRAMQLAQRMRERFSQGLVGQDELRESLIITLIAGGHILIESVPGLAKTTAARLLASCVSGSFKRIQCTPDLMPADLVGTQVFDFATQKMITQIGPVHANIVLLDEINRSSAKTQSAMLESMAEGATTIGGERIALPQPFMVIATQNPVEEEGTYNLPEAQMDRFMMKTVMTYPTAEQEVAMLSMLGNQSSDSMQFEKQESHAISLSDVSYLRSAARRVHVSDEIKKYVVDLVSTSRGAGRHPIKGLASLVRLGASPRASISLIRIAQAQALINGRDYVIPEDVKAHAHSVLRHRIIMTFEALADGITSDQVIDTIISTVPVP
ncbi:MoxR family ATPase [Alloscardovia omnicolens]